jgi:hypothetical protein
LFRWLLTGLSLGSRARNDFVASRRDEEMTLEVPFRVNPARDELLLPLPPLLLRTVDAVLSERREGCSLYLRVGCHYGFASVDEDA